MTFFWLFIFFSFFCKINLDFQVTTFVPLPLFFLRLPTAAPLWKLCVPQCGSCDCGSDELNDLVSDARAAARGEGQEVGRLPEAVLLVEEPLRTVLLGPIPVLRREIGVVVVDEYHGVFGNMVFWKQTYLIFGHISNINILFVIKKFPI